MNSSRIFRGASDKLNGAERSHIFVPLYRRPYAWLKRIIDICLFLIVLVPALLLIAIFCVLIKLETRGPAFFTQQRAGYRCRAFKLLKLRTMILETEKDGRELTDVERTTPLGRIIRACSIDELPQIFNIMLGQMSFIGPRPLPVKYLPRYSREQARRHDVLPGISGLAQTSGRNEISWEQRFERDIWYVDHMSLGLDFRIFWKTIANVITRSGVNSGADETMKEFGK